MNNEMLEMMQEKMRGELKKAGVTNLETIERFLQIHAAQISRVWHQAKIEMEVATTS